MTKEEFAKEVENYFKEHSLCSLSQELLKTAQDNNFVIVTGVSDDLIEFEGAIRDEENCYDGETVWFSSSGFFRNECEEGDGCPYFDEILENNKWAKLIREIKVYWGGKCQDYKMPIKQYKSLGEPTWCYEVDFPHATFDVYDEDEFYCKGIVFNLKECFQ
jgi:hypothetical protein